MRPILETLELRDVPGLTYTFVHPYGEVANYPVAPEGQQVVAAQDFANVVSPFAPFKPTPLMPAPPAACAALDYNEVSDWQADGYGYMATASWLAVQSELYSFETTNPFWLGWLAQVQAGVAAANAELFAAQDAFWADPVSSPLQEPLVNSLIVDALLSLEEKKES